jgi:hypothetical protein
MKNYPFIIVMLFASVLCNAQLIQNNGITTDKEDFAKPKFSNQKSLPIWEVTFEEETPIWTFGSISGTKTWAVGETTPTNGYLYQGNPNSPMWVYMGQRYVSDYSNSGGNFAWIDGISDYLELLPGAAFDSFIQFDNIDLSTSQHPKVCFYQNYKKYNYDQCFVDFSNDGGITWQTEQINQELLPNEIADEYYEVLIPQIFIGSTDLSIRFRWQNTTNPYQNACIGWEIDDIKILENPDYDIGITDYRVNFFDYVDYTIPENAVYYHISSHYGKIPQAVFTSDWANMWFNVTVKNNGNYDVTPSVIVRVYDPEMNEIFFTSLMSDSSIPPFQSDTIDILEQDFHPGYNPIIGLYTIQYSIELEGVEENTIENNTAEAYFEVSQNQYSRAHNEPETEKGICDLSSGGVDGERMGTTFTLFEETEISSIDIYIGETSTVGNSFVAGIYTFDDEVGDWVMINVSTLIDIEEGMLGSWLNVTFLDPAFISIPEGETGIQVLIAIECYYQTGEGAIRLGIDNDVIAGNWGIIYYFANESTWYYINSNSGGLCINLNLEGNVILTCPEDMVFCSNESPVDLLGVQSPAYAFSGTGIVDNWFFPEIAGIGTHLITLTYNGGEQTCNFFITVNESPELKTVTNTPASGILELGNFGTISVLDSDLETQYYVTRNNIEVTALFSGNATELALGDQFLQGAYQVWATNAASCRVPLDIVNFVENTGTAKIVVSVDYGENPILLNGDDVVVNLYHQTTEGDETLITLNSTLQPGEVGQVIFDDLSAGTYFVASSIGEFTEVDLNENVFYDNALTFDDATPIEITEGQIVFIEISHEQDNLVEGSNEGSGTVGEQPEGKSLNPLEGIAVVLRNADTQEIIDIALTDENGNYTFPAIPDNSNIQIFVTMPESPVWTAYNAETQTNQTLEVDFIVVGNSVYPSTSKIAGNVVAVKNIEIYPNPVAEILNIKSENNICEAVIYDLSGRMLISVIGENITGISTQNISAGSYLLICTDKNGVPFVNKFVKE